MRRLINLLVKSVDLVDNPANQQPFLVVKNKDQEASMPQTVSSIETDGADEAAVTKQLQDGGAPATASASDSTTVSAPGATAGAAPIEKSEDGSDGGDVEIDKAVWTTAYVNDLPNSAFLYVESGGKKDKDGKTVPRSLRHLPVRDADGKIDLPHLRNAIARIPQMVGVSDQVKAKLQAQARRMLAEATGSGQKKDVHTDAGQAPAAAQEAPMSEEIKKAIDEADAMFADQQQFATNLKEALQGVVDTVVEKGMDPEKSAAATEQAIKLLNSASAAPDCSEQVKSAIAKALDLINKACKGGNGGGDKKMRKDTKTEPEGESVEKSAHRTTLEAAIKQLGDATQTFNESVGLMKKLLGEVKVDKAAEPPPAAPPAPVAEPAPAATTEPVQAAPAAEAPAITEPSPVEKALKEFNERIAKMEGMVGVSKAAPEGTKPEGAVEVNKSSFWSGVV